MHTLDHCSMEFADQSRGCVFFLSFVSQIVEMPEHNPGDLGGTMRLGKRKTNFVSKDSILRKLDFFAVVWVFFFFLST